MPNMPATLPSFTTKGSGDTIASSFMNNLQDELVETARLFVSGAASDLTIRADRDNNASGDVVLGIGSSVTKFVKLLNSGSFRYKNVGNASFLHTHDLTIDAVEDAYAMNGSREMTTAQWSDTQVGIGTDRNSTLQAQTKQSVTQADSLVGGFWDVNKSGLGNDRFFSEFSVTTWWMRTIFPLLQAEIATECSQGGLNNADKHVKQNVSQITAYGFGDCALELNTYGGMINTLLIVNDTHDHDSAIRSPETGIIIKCQESAGGTNIVQPFQVWHYGIPYSNRLFTIYSMPSFNELIDIRGPLDTPNGSGTKNGSYADMLVSGYVKPYALALVDGVTAPSALTGRALIYVDTADGDLKVKFADGVTKTLATDT